MKTIRHLIYGEVMASVGFVTLGFLALFFFFDFVDELQSIGKGALGATYQVRHALLYVALRVPTHWYELLPIAVLIGTIFVMARLAQSSEYTILRTSGLGPGRALQTLLGLGAVFAALTFVVGDYLAPLSDRTAQVVKARFEGRMSIGQAGAWLKEKLPDGSYAVNVGALAPDGAMRGVRVFEFDADGFMRAQTVADSARFGSNNTWEMTQVSRSEFTRPGSEVANVVRRQLDTYPLPTAINAEMVSVALLKPDRMSTVDLFQYIQHLQTNGQTAQRYEIEFWRKVFYPVSCLVMVVLALPFAYLHFRSGGITGYVFVGVMIGISFFLLNNVFGYVGNLRNWEPWLAAASPGLLYVLLSLGAFGWLVLRR